MRNSIPCNFFSSNQFRVKFFSEKVDFTEFLFSDKIVAVKVRNIHTVKWNIVFFCNSDNPDFR